MTNKSGIEGPRLTNQGKKVPDSDPDRGSQTLSESVDQQIRDLLTNILTQGPRPSECKTRFRVWDSLTNKSGIVWVPDYTNQGFEGPRL